MDASAPRGIRDNNPGNLRPGAVKWYGEIEPDGGYCRFASPHTGIRALAKNLVGYQRSHGLHTIREFISRWAPPSDHNDTEAYIDSVSQGCGIDPDASVDLFGSALAAIVTAIIRHENGMQPYSAAAIDLACAEACV